MARPSHYTSQLAAKICERLLSGRSLRSICSEDDDMPSASTVFSWLSKHKEFAEQYTRAKEAMAEAVFWEIFDIADDGRNDTYIDDKNQLRTNHDVITRSRLRVDTRKWALARMSPKKYGDKSQLDLISTDRTMSPANMSEEEKFKKINEIIERAQRRKALHLASVAAREDGSDLV